MRRTSLSQPICLHHVELAKGGLAISGGEKCLIELCRYFDKQGYTNVIYVPENGKIAYERNGVFGPNTEFKVIGSYRTEQRLGWGFGLLVSYLLRVIQGVLSVARFDKRATHVIVSHSHFWPTVFLALWMKLRNPGATWIAFNHMLTPSLWRGFEGEYTGQHQMPSARLFYHWLNDRLFFLLARQASFLVVTNPVYLKTVRRYHRNCRVVLYGSDASSFVDQVQNEPLELSRDYECVFVGRCHHQKGILQLANIWLQVLKSIPGATLAMVGSDMDNALGSQFRATLRAHGADDRVEILGAQEGIDKYRTLLRSRVFVFPSLYESFGIVAIEAMSCGLPVIAYNLPIFQVFEQGMTKVPVCDNDAFAAEIIRLLSDQMRYAQKSREASEFAASFSWDRTGHQFESIILEIASRRLQEQPANRCSN